MSYPYKKLLRHFTDIRPIPSVNGLIIESRDMRGKSENIDVMNFSSADLYNLLNEVYHLGQEDARQKIKNALEGR